VITKQLNFYFTNSSRVPTMVIVLQCSHSDDENQDLKNIDLDLSELDRNDLSNRQTD
jgi:hypothetical protein